jgi:hypothetical protein
MSFAEFMTLQGLLLLMVGCISLLGATADSIGIALGICILGLGCIVCAGAIAVIKRILRR